MSSLDSFTRKALAATAVMNLVGSLAFTPAGEGVRTAFGIPPAHPLWPLMVGTFLAAMGAGYASLAITGRGERTFLAVAAAGKSAFGLLMLAAAALGSVPARAGLAGLPDLVFAVIFVRWLVRSDASKATENELQP